MRHPLAALLFPLLLLLLAHPLCAQGQDQDEDDDLLEFTRPEYSYTRRITPEDVEAMNLRDLVLARNTIFAMHGREFQRVFLHEYFSAQDWYHPGRFDPASLSQVERENAAFLSRYEASLPASKLRQRAEEILTWHHEHGSLEPGERDELELIARAIGWRPPEVAALIGDGQNPLDAPTMLDGILKVSQLQHMSRRELRLVRNMVFARRGYTFKSEILGKFFGRYDWYRPDPGYTDARLTVVDQRNIKLVQSVEAEHGGPLSDQEHGWEAACGGMPCA